MEPSHVITALGVESGDATGAIRFTLGRETTQKQLDRTVDVLKVIVSDLREMSSTG